MGDLPHLRSFRHVERDEYPVDGNNPAIGQRVAGRSCSDIARVIKIDNSITIQLQPDASQGILLRGLRQFQAGQAARDDVVADEAVGV